MTPEMKNLYIETRVATLRERIAANMLSLAERLQQQATRVANGGIPCAGEFSRQATDIDINAAELATLMGLIEIK